MARTVNHADLRSRTRRMLLPIRNKPYWMALNEGAHLGPVDKGDSQKGQYLIQGSFWGGYLDPGFDERRGMGLP